MQFDQCTDEAITGAVQVLDWNHRFHDPNANETKFSWYSWAPKM